MPSNQSPKISVISPSLNHGRFLRETIESVLAQSYKNIEHVIVDGASTDNTLEILKEYPHLKWISEKEEGDNKVLDAIWKGLHMSTGDYIVFLCVSDCMVDTNWFKKAVNALEKDKEVSHVWGVVQAISENGTLGKVWNAERLSEEPPPQKKDFLPFWLATAEGIECNAVFRRDIFEKCYTRNNPDEAYRFAPGLGFNYYLNTQGYIPYFLPIITICGRIHAGQQGVKNDNLDAGSDAYFRDVKLYKKKLLAGKIRHYFRDGNSQIIGEVTPTDIAFYKKVMWKYRVRNSLQRKFHRFLKRII